MIVSGYSEAARFIERDKQVNNTLQPMAPCVCRFIQLNHGSHLTGFVWFTAHRILKFYGVNLVSSTTSSVLPDPLSQLIFKPDIDLLKTSKII